MILHPVFVLTLSFIIRSYSCLFIPIGF
jgi:hypothetical protein